MAGRFKGAPAHTRRPLSGWRRSPEGVLEVPEGADHAGDRRTLHDGAGVGRQENLHRGWQRHERVGADVEEDGAYVACENRLLATFRLQAGHSGVQRVVELLVLLSERRGHDTRPLPVSKLRDNVPYLNASPFSVFVYLSNIFVIRPYITNGNTIIFIVERWSLLCSERCAPFNKRPVDMRTRFI